MHNVREIFARGQELGRNPRRFSRTGDSIIDTTQFLAPFDGDSYNLGDFAYLQPAIDQFAGSFKRQGVAVRKGLTSSSVQNPAWADDELCRSNESLLDCELRLQNPSVILIFLGTNDSSWLLLDEGMRELVTHTIQLGVIPVIATKANRIEDDNSYNNVLRRIAEDFQIPLLDFDLVAEKMPDRGLDIDGVHLMAFPEADYTLTRSLYSGQGAHSLTALMMLDALVRNIFSAEH